MGPSTQTYLSPSSHPQRPRPSRAVAKGYHIDVFPSAEPCSIAQDPNAASHKGDALVNIDSEHRRCKTQGQMLHCTEVFIECTHQCAAFSTAEHVYPPGSFCTFCLYSVARLLYPMLPGCGIRDLMLAPHHRTKVSPWSCCQAGVGPRHAPLEEQEQKASRLRPSPPSDARTVVRLCRRHRLASR